MVPGHPRLGRDRFELVDSKVKAALTRHYNSVEHKSQALVPTLQRFGGKKRRGGGGGGGDDMEDGDGTIEGTTAS